MVPECRLAGCLNEARLSANGRRRLLYCSDFHRVKAAVGWWKARQAIRAGAIRTRKTTTSGHDRRPFLATVVINGQAYYRYGATEAEAAERLDAALSKGGRRRG